LVAMLRLGQNEQFAMSKDSYERILVCLRVLIHPDDKFFIDIFLNQCRQAYKKLVEQQVSAPTEVKRGPKV